MFVTFEGIEGCGKSTQIKKLNQALKERGIPCLLTREPGGTPIGQQIRAVLLDQKNKRMDPLAELFLYLADRCQHLSERIRPALAEGKWVLCDRFWDATVVYQGMARGLDLKMLERIRPWVLGPLVPDLTFLLDCPVEEGLARAWKRIRASGQPKKEIRFEKESVDFHKRIRQGYLSLVRKEPDRFQVVDSTRPAEEVHRQIIDRIFSPGKQG